MASNEITHPLQVSTTESPVTTMADLGTPLDPVALAKLHDIKNAPQHAVASAVQITQTKHRIQLVEGWKIGKGEKVLEIGCGQGDTTCVLAAVVGEEGNVVAVDPAPLDYGNPYTLGQAQAQLKKTFIGPRIDFVQQDPIVHLNNLPKTEIPIYTSAIMAQMTYYLSNSSILLDILTALRPHTPRLCLAEYSLTAPSSRPGAFPHILATLAQAALAAHMPESALHGNIRTVLSPSSIKSLAAQAGWKVESEEIFTPVEKYQDGGWEVHFVLDKGFREEVEKYVKDERQRRVLEAMADAVRLSKESLGELKVVSMDVWTAVFVHA